MTQSFSTLNYEHPTPQRSALCARSAIMLLIAGSLTLVLSLPLTLLGLWLLPMKTDFVGSGGIWISVHNLAWLMISFGGVISLIGTLYLLGTPHVRKGKPRWRSILLFFGLFHNLILLFLLTVGIIAMIQTRTLLPLPILLLLPQSLSALGALHSLFTLRQRESRIPSLNLFPLTPSPNAPTPTPPRTSP